MTCAREFTARRLAALRAERAGLDAAAAKRASRMAALLYRAGRSVDAAARLGVQAAKGRFPC